MLEQASGRSRRGSVSRNWRRRRSSAAGDAPQSLPPPSKGAGGGIAGAALGFRSSAEKPAEKQYGRRARQLFFDSRASGRYIISTMQSKPRAVFLNDTTFVTKQRAKACFCFVSPS